MLIASTAKETRAGNDNSSVLMSPLLARGDSLSNPIARQLPKAKAVKMQPTAKQTTPDLKDRPHIFGRYRMQLKTISVHTQMMNADAAHMNSCIPV